MLRTPFASAESVNIAGVRCPTDSTQPTVVQARSAAAAASMAQPFDIFKIAKDGDPVWLEAADTLDAATARVNALRESYPGDYMILSQRTGKRIVFTARGGIKRD